MVRAIEATDARVVLVTSAGDGEGKDFLMNVLAEELDTIAPGRFILVSRTRLRRSPSELPKDRRAVVVGPPVLSGSDILEVPQAWMGLFDGALVLAVKRFTLQSDLDATLRWLEASQIPPLGILWNEHRHPPVATAVKRKLLRLARMFGMKRLPPQGRSVDAEGDEP